MSEEKVIRISDFFSLSIQSRVEQIMQNFVQSEKLCVVILDLVQEVYKIGINSPKSIFLQEDIINILIYSYKNTQQIEEMFEALNQKNLIRFFRKILKKHAKYYIRMSRCIDKYLVKEEDELDRNKIKRCFENAIGDGFKKDFLLQLDESTDMMTFLDNKKLEINDALEILGSYLNIENLKGKMFLF